MNPDFYHTALESLDMPSKQSMIDTVHPMNRVYANKQSITMMLSHIESHYAQDFIDYGTYSHYWK